MHHPIESFFDALYFSLSGSNTSLCNTKLFKHSLNVGARKQGGELGADVGRHFTDNAGKVASQERETMLAVNALLTSLSWSSFFGQSDS